jgi:hypothetical protein
VRSIPFQRSLTLNVVLGVVVLGAVLLIISLIASRRVASLIAEDLTLRVLREGQLAGNDLLNPIANITEVAASWVDEGWFDDVSDESLIRAIRGVVDATDMTITGVHFATSDGDHVYVVSTDEGDLAVRVDPSDPGLIQRILFADSGPPVVTRIPNEAGDVRENSWFAEAVEQYRLNPGSRIIERRVLTDLRPLPVTGKPGLTISMAIAGRDGKIIVLAYDVLGTSVRNFFKEIRIRDRGTMSIFLVNDKTGELERFAPNDEGSAAAPTADLASDASPSAAFVRGLPRLPDGAAVRRFSFAGEDWWGGIEAADRGEERGVWFVAAVPEDELLGITDPFVYVIIVTAIIVVLASLRARVLSARYAGPVRALVDQSERMARLDFNQGDPIRSGIRELDVLARSQDRTRAALESFTATDEEIKIARSIREFDEQSFRAQAGNHEIAVTFAEGEQPACELALAVDVVANPGSVVSSLVPAGKGTRTIAIQLSAPTTALDGAMLAREFAAAFRQSARLREDPALVLLDLDRYCRERYPDLGLVSACCVALRSGEDSISVAASGDPVVFIVGPEGHETLDLAGTSLGLMSEVEVPVSKSITLSPGSIVVVCPRRITESLSRERVPLGVDTLAAGISAAAQPGVHLDEVLSTASVEIRTSIGRERLETDLVAIAVRRRAAGEG